MNELDDKLKGELNFQNNKSKKEIKQQQIEAYFDSFGDIENNIFNTKVLYKENNIDFICLNGEKFNIKLKNKIENIFPLSDGILIKLDYPDEEFQFFKNSKMQNKINKNLTNNLNNINNTNLLTENKNTKKFIYYLINNHPLNTLTIIKNNIFESGNDNIVSENNLNFISVSNEIPLLVNLTKNGEFDLYCLLYKQSNFKNDFGNYLGKILNSASDKKCNNITPDNFNIFLNESSFYFYELIPNIGKEIDDEFFGKAKNHNNELNRANGYYLNLEISFFKNFCDENAYFLSIVNKEDNNLLIFRIEFPNNHSNQECFLEAKITQKKLFKNIAFYGFIDNLFTDFSNVLFTDRREFEKKFFGEIIFHKDINSKLMETCDYKNIHEKNIFNCNNEYINNYLLQYDLKEEMKIYKEEKKPRKYLNIFYYSEESNQILILENLKILFILNLQEIIMKSSLYNNHENKILMTDKKIQMFKVMSLSFNRKFSNFFGMIQNLDKQENSPIKFDLIFRFDDIILMKVMEFFKFIYKQFKLLINENNDYLKFDQGNTRLIEEEKENDIYNVFAKILFDYILLRDSLSKSRFSKIKKSRKNKLAKYFFEFLEILIFLKIEDLKNTEDFNSLDLDIDKYNSEVDKNLIESLNINAKDFELFKNIPIFREIIMIKKTNDSHNNLNPPNNKTKKNKYKNIILDFVSNNKKEIISLKNVFNKIENFESIFIKYCCELYESYKLFNFNSCKWENEDKTSDKMNSSLNIFSSFILSQISRFQLLEKLKYLDFINYNFGLNVENKFSGIQNNSKNIISEKELFILLKSNQMNEKFLSDKKYISLTKFFTNFTFGNFKQDVYFTPIFRNVYEIIIILSIHFTKNNIQYMDTFLNILLLGEENTTEINLNKINSEYFSNNQIYIENNLIQKNDLGNTPDNLNIPYNSLYERDLNSANNTYFNFKGLSNGKLINKNYLENFHLYSKYFYLSSQKNVQENFPNCKNYEINNNVFETKFSKNRNLGSLFTQKYLFHLQKHKNFITHNFKYFLLVEKPQIFSSNFAVSLINAGLSQEKIKEMLPCISLMFLEKISNMKINTNSYKILTDNNPQINQKILLLIGRIDMARNLKAGAITDNLSTVKNESSDYLNHIYKYKNSSTIKKSLIKNNSILSNMLYTDTTTILEPEYYLANLKFNLDSRFYEALRILNPYNPIRINSEFLNENNNLNNNFDPERIEKEKLQIAYKKVIKQLSAYFGAGALNLNTIKNFPKDVINMKNINTTILFSHDNSSLKADFNSDQFINYLTSNNYNNFYNLQNISQNTNREKEFLKWPEFNSGVSQAIKLSSEFLRSNNSSYIRNWILFNKPNPNNSNNSNSNNPNISLNPDHQHGGFIFGMGLLKVLDNLYSTDIYQYMKSAQEGITIGIMLGRAVSKISTMEDSTSRTLCLHISYLIPASLEINIPMSVQCSAIFSLGLLYQSTCNRLMTEMLLNQIGKKPNVEKSQNINLAENYNLCLGFSIGLINLGMGNYAKLYNEDLRLEEKLLNFANGGKKFDFVNLPNRSFYNYNNNYMNQDKNFLSGNSAIFRGNNISIFCYLIIIDY